MSGARDGDFELVTLANGTRAVKHLPSGEVMHPAIGPWEEANALYVRQLGLAGRLGRAGAPLTILDVGLGAATNAAAALACAAELKERRALRIVSFEIDLAPLRLALADAQGFPFLVPFREAATALVERGRFERDGLIWELRLGDAREELKSWEGRAALVFHDPFSPETNPTLWTPEAFALVRSKCSDEALLATYSASTRTRVSMLLGGFQVGVGEPVGSKRETTVAAVRRENLSKPLDARWLERWKRSTARAPHGHEALTEEMSAAVERSVRSAGGPAGD